jgi:NADPH-dependent F420 reductase
MTADLATVAIIGGTGALGAAIARRLAKAGYSVVLGSRDAQRAAAAANAIRESLSATPATPSGSMTLQGTDNRDAAEQASLIILAVPFASQESTLTQIAPAVRGKIVVDTTVPLVPPKVMRVQLPTEGCAALRAQALLGTEATVVSAFHNVAAHKLATDAEIDCDVLVFGDQRAAREQVISLIEACGLRGLHGGALCNSAAAEALTSVLIFLNRTYDMDGAGIRITGELSPPKAQ